MDLKSLNMRSAAQFRCTSAGECERRRRILNPESLCWNAYKRSYSETSTSAVDHHAEEIRQHLAEVFFKLHKKGLRSYLCCICRCIDFDWFYDGKRSSRGLVLWDKIPLGHFDDLDSRCPLCQMIRHSVDNDPSLANMKSSLVCFLDCVRYTGQRKDLLRVMIWATPLDGQFANKHVSFRNLTYLDYYKQEPNLYRFVKSIRLVKIARDSTWLPWRRTDVYGREIGPTVNFRRIRKLLRVLDQERDLFKRSRWFVLSNSHMNELQAWNWQSLIRLLARESNITRPRLLPHVKDDLDSSLELPSNFRVIDVYQCCLVDPPTNVRFIALSYVWGKVVPPVPLLSRESCPSLYIPSAISRLGESVPRSVRDAMIATKCLGERFLWTDALCIIQDDEHEKMDQINKMSGVYRRASFTVVTAAGDDANAGLPGVGSTRRYQWQYTVGHRQKRFANNGRGLDDCLIGCHWLTRGWTYQELALSSRLVIFTEHEVFVVDAKQAITMDNAFTYRSESNVSQFKAEGIANSFQDHIVSKPRDALGLYSIALDAYSRRKLTFQSDTVNAFQGIAGYLNPELRGGYTFGLPNTLLEVCLSWAIYNNSISNTNTKFSSYSWASRDQRVFLERYPQSRWPSSRVIWRNFHPERQKEWICQEDFMPTPESEDALKWEFVSAGTIIDGPTNPKRIGVTRPFWKDITEHSSWQHAWPILPRRLLPPFQPAESSTGHLILWTHVISLFLEPPKYDQRAQAMISGDSVPRIGKSSYEVGMFDMDQPTVTNPIEAMLLYKYEKHNGFPVPTSQCVENPLPWDVAKIQQDLAMVEKRHQAVEPISDSALHLDRYVVLAIETVNGISYRRGVGTVEVSWFHQASPQRRCVVLG